MAENQPSENVPATPPILRFFEYEHLPAKLRPISQPFWHLARLMISSVKGSAELSAGLRKLLEAKDCMVRAAL